MKEVKSNTGHLGTLRNLYQVSLVYSAMHSLYGASSGQNS